MRRPRVIINCAMSADGKIASPTGRQMRISCDEDLQRMYRLRHECDAVLVGVGTIIADDPKLSVKDTYVTHPKQPVRVVLDTKGRTPPHALVLNDAAKTMIITAKGMGRSYEGSHIEVVECATDSDGYIDVHCVLDFLYSRGIRSLLVEGGGTVIWNFLTNKVVDDLYIYIGSCIIGGTQTPTLAEGKGIGNDDPSIPLTIVEVKRLGPGVLIHYQPLK
jgi:2,5-diamino-6-(ribosylamino)-4(3H)-pyrimidinone 5'-phosphate reductase